MGTCLITKLASTVDADLPIFGELEFKIKSAPGTFGRIYGSTYPFRVYVKDGTAKLRTSSSGSYSSEVSVTAAATTIYFADPSGSGYTVCVENKSNINGFNFGNMSADSVEMDMSELKYNTLGTQFELCQSQYLYGNIDGYDFRTLTRFTCNGNYSSATRNTVTGNIGAINAPNLTFLSVCVSGITGSINTLNAPNLETLRIYNTNITGDLKVWAENMWNNGSGRTSGRCFLLGTNGQRIPCTWNGQTIEEALNNAHSCYINFSSSGVTLTAS